MSSLSAIIFSFIHGVTFFLYQANYRRLRRDYIYKSEKQAVQNMPVARKITKVAFAFSSIMVGVSFWVSEGVFGFFSTPLCVRGIGLTISFLAFLFLKKALLQLGKNYSPLFDTHKPQFIVKQGLYRYIRHPVYLCNILIILGYVLSSSCLWVFISSLWGWGYMLRSILREEEYLAAEFVDYRDYQKSTWRIIPFLF